MAHKNCWTKKEDEEVLEFRDITVKSWRCLFNVLRRKRNIHNINLNVTHCVFVTISLLLFLRKKMIFSRFFYNLFSSLWAMFLFPWQSFSVLQNIEPQNGNLKMNETLIYVCLLYIPLSSTSSIHIIVPDIHHDDCWYFIENYIIQVLIKSNFFSFNKWIWSLHLMEFVIVSMWKQHLTKAISHHLYFVSSLYFPFPINVKLECIFCTEKPEHTL